MDKRLYAGIDPGQTGGLGIVGNSGGFVGCHRWNQREPRALYNILINYRDMIEIIYLENVNLPTGGAGIDNRFCATGNLLVNLGIWTGWLIALDLPVISIAPITWQAAVGLHRWKSKLVVNPAGLTPLTLARSQWPGAPLEHKADDGKAVGLLLAHLAQRDARAGIDRRVIQAQAATKKKAKRAQAKKNREIGPTSDIGFL